MSSVHPKEKKTLRKVRTLTGQSSEIRNITEWLEQDIDTVFVKVVYESVGRRIVLGAAKQLDTGPGLEKSTCQHVNTRSGMNTGRVWHSQVVQTHRSAAPPAAP